ncbi:hypothetical protein ACTFIW_000454 [Dictyostelium discoideum]
MNIPIDNENNYSNNEVTPSTPPPSSGLSLSQSISKPANIILTGENVGYNENEKLEIYKPIINKLDNQYDTVPLNPPHDLFNNQPAQFDENLHITYYSQTTNTTMQGDDTQQIPYGDIQLPQIIVRNGDNEDQQHFIFALIFFILGFFTVIFWIVNIKFLKSRNKNARTLSNLSIIFTFVFILLLFIAVISSVSG